MGIREIIKKRFNSSGFTMIEMIAAMVLVSILVPGISVIVRGSLMNVAFTNMAVLANMEANYAQRKFIKDINYCSDSQGIWRFKSPQENIEENSKEKDNF